MRFKIGEVIVVDGEVCEVVGAIEYRNPDNHESWFEYKLWSRQYNREKWLSYDDEYKEYSIMECGAYADTTSFHEVDRGTEEVISVWGDVDVEIGDVASFVEYEDTEEEHIISVERWDDGEEYSTGYYLDLEEIRSYGFEPARNDREASGDRALDGRAKKTKSLNVVIGVMIFIVIASIVLPELIYVASVFLPKNSEISEYLAKNYEYVTSITGENSKKADVYLSQLDVEQTAKDIIRAIKGKTSDVHQNKEEEDHSIAIMTKNEYCLIYESEDNEVLVQISSREYVYVSERDPYRARRYTGLYYRNHYYYSGYRSDSDRYGGRRSIYDTYQYSGDDSWTYDDSYNTYASGIRQTSVRSRNSMGGGTSFGK